MCICSICRYKGKFLVIFACVFMISRWLSTQGIIPPGYVQSNQKSGQSYKLSFVVSKTYPPNRLISQLLRYNDNTFTGYDLIYKHKCRYLEHFDVILKFFPTQVMAVFNKIFWKIDLLHSQYSGIVLFFHRGRFYCGIGEPENIINLCKGVLLCFY